MVDLVISLPSGCTIDLYEHLAKPCASNIKPVNPFTLESFSDEDTQHILNFCKNLYKKVKAFAEKLPGESSRPSLDLDFTISSKSKKISFLEAMNHFDTHGSLTDILLDEQIAQLKMLCEKAEEALRSIDGSVLRSFKKVLEQGTFSNRCQGVVRLSANQRYKTSYALR